jgi:hypothetical protein
MISNSSSAGLPPDDAADGPVHDETPKRKRRRRRRIALAILLLVVSVTGWWYCPRGDGRFVGKWGVVLNALEPHAPVTWDLRANGWAAFLDPQGNATGYFRWRVSDGKFSNGYPDGSIARKTTRLIAPLFVRLTGRRIDGIYDEVPIVSVEPDRIILGEETETFSFLKTLTRLPE